MDITDVRIRLIRNKEARVKAVASITIDECFVVHDVKVIEGIEGYYITMPSKRVLGSFKDVAHPLNSETRDIITRVVLEAFDKIKMQTELSDVTNDISEILQGVALSEAE